jgi:2-polyprenyl-6-methoxyphenol hydroxylase-like FAD-dependent oxidoreductase
LQEVANSFPSVSVRFGWSVEEVTQDKEGVMVRVLEIENGRRHTISARYIAACDGGSSPIRTATKTKLQGEFSLGSQMAIFFRSSELRNNPQGRVMMWILANRDLFGAIIAVDGQDLFTFHHLLTSATRPIDYNASQALRAALGRDIDFDIISVNHWTSHLALVERYRRGRVFFVGDAAHLLVPNAGLGMNTGIADACDLGWKLSAVSQGWADESLLNSYELERRPIAQRNLAFAKTAVEQLNFSNMSPNIEDGGPTGEALRQKFRQVTEERRPKELESIGLQLGYRYRNSPICVSDGTPEQNDDFGLYVPTARPGARAPHTVLDDGTVLYDLLGDWFTLLRLGGSKVSTSALEASAAKYSVPLKVLDILQPDVRALFETDLVLIRPDQHVAWRGQELPRDPDTVINCIRGALVALATKQSTGN